MNIYTPIILSLLTEKKIIKKSTVDFVRELWGRGGGGSGYTSFLFLIDSIGSARGEEMIHKTCV